MNYVCYGIIHKRKINRGIIHKRKINNINLAWTQFFFLFFLNSNIKLHLSKVNCEAKWVIKKKISSSMSILFNQKISDPVWDGLQKGHFQTGEGKHEAVFIASLPSRIRYFKHTPCLPHTCPEKYNKIMPALPGII